MKPTLLSFFFVLKIFLAQAQITIKYNNTQYTNKVTEIVDPFKKYVSKNMLAQLDSLDQEINKEYTIFIKDDGTTLATINGLLDVYLWENNKWKNLYKGRFGGHNFDSYNFIYLGELYSFGGYGYWTHNNHLIKFNRVKGEWQFMGKLNTTNALIRPFVAKVDNRLIITGGKYEQDNSIVVNEEVFEFNLNTLKVNKKKAKTTSEIFLHVYEKTSTQIKNFIIAQYYAQNKINILIYDIQKEEYLINKTTNLKIGKASLSYVKDDELFFYETDSTVKSVKLEDLLLSEESPTISSKPNYEFTLIISIAVAFILFFFNYAIRRRRKKPLTQANNSVEKSHKNQSGLDNLEYNEYIRVLREFEGQIITAEDLDRYLNIESLHMDSQRARRSQIIKRINSYSNLHFGYTYIHRVKDENDKRYVNYWIGKSQKMIKGSVQN